MRTRLPKILIAGLLTLGLLSACNGPLLLSPRPLISAGPLQLEAGDSVSLRLKLDLDPPAGALRTQAIPPQWTDAAIELFNPDLLRSDVQSLTATLSSGDFTDNTTVSPPLPLTNLRPGGGYIMNVRLLNSGSLVASGTAGPFALTSSAGQLVKVTLRFTYDMVSTLAGSGAAGFVNGAGTGASFSSPQAVTTDSAGNIYVADASSIRKIDSSLNVSTIAGNGTATFTNSINPLLCQFNNPQGLALRSDGILFIADTGNHRLRLVDLNASSQLTIAGSATPGSADGTGGDISFNSPSGLALDDAGNLFLVDTGNHRIRKLINADSNDVVEATTLAGSILGDADGSGAGARFKNPTGIVYDSLTGLLYVTDSGNFKIKSVDPASGVVKTVAGTGGAGFLSGPGTSATFDTPTGISSDGNGNLYVTDTGNHIIRQITRAGNVSTISGTPGISGEVLTNGYGLESTFFAPQALAVNGSGEILVADTSNHRIRKLAAPIAAFPIITSIKPLGGAPGIPVTLNGVGFGRGAAAGVNSVAFSGVPATVTSESTSQIAVTVPSLATSGLVSVGHHGMSAVRQPYFQVINPFLDIAFYAGVAGSSGFADGAAASAKFNSPTSIVTDGTDYYVADTGNRRIRKVGVSILVSTVAGNGTNAVINNADPLLASFRSPFGLARSSGGTFYVSDSTGHTIRQFTIGGAVSTLAGAAGSFGIADGAGGEARFSSPRGLALDAVGNLYVADACNHSIRKVTSAGVVSTLAGAETGSSPFTCNTAPGQTLVDGQGRQARFNLPEFLAVDASGNVIVADFANNAIRKVTPGGFVTTIAGNGSSGFRDGPAQQARFNGPSGLYVHNDGSIYVLDSGNGVLRKIDVFGQVSTVAGNGQLATVDGSGALASIKFPRGLVYLNGEFYFTDQLDHLIREITDPGAGA